MGKYKDNFGKIRTIWGILGQFGEYKDNLGNIRTIWGKLGQFGKYKDNLGKVYRKDPLLRFSKSQSCVQTLRMEEVLVLTKMNDSLRLYIQIWLIYTDNSKTIPWPVLHSVKFIQSWYSIQSWFSILSCNPCSPKMPFRPKIHSVLKFDNFLLRTI